MGRESQAHFSLMSLVTHNFKPRPQKFKLTAIIPEVNGMS